MNTYRLAFAEAHAYVTLEAYVVGTREFEGVETGQQRLGVGVVIPFSEYRRIGSAPVFIGHYVLVFNVVFDCLRHTASCESSVNTCLQATQKLKTIGDQTGVNVALNSAISHERHYLNNCFLILFM